jgi:O-antigen ligase
LALSRWRTWGFAIPFFLLAIIFSKSTGGLIGIAAGIGVLLLFHKKTRAPALILAGMVLIAVFLLPSDKVIRQELLAQNRSGQIRIAMWKEAGQLLADRPLLGAGLASYTERVEPYHTTVNG